MAIRSLVNVNTNTKSTNLNKSSVNTVCVILVAHEQNHIHVDCVSIEIHGIEIAYEFVFSFILVDECIFYLPTHFSYLIVWTVSDSNESCWDYWFGGVFNSI